MKEPRLYSLFEKQDGKWVRMFPSAYPKPIAIRLFQNALLAPYLLSGGPVRELRVVKPATELELKIRDEAIADLEKIMIDLNSEYEAAVVGFGKEIADKAAGYSILEGWNPAALAGGSTEECTKAQYTAFAGYLFDVLYGDR